MAETLTGSDTSLALTAQERDYLANLLETVLKDTRIEEHRTRTPLYRESVLRERKLSGESGEQIPAHRQDRIVSADIEHVQDELAGDQRHQRKRNPDRDRGDRNVPPVDECAPSFGQPRRHS